ncbi:GNAT family N-acetyltransferase [Aureimonas jatrophae]|uniref:Acetyltransferase (GNAT) domain-containing protein n=1 Tax=Aureimonas jatrophae TaxID=1166073 RepID=A0A1H0BWR0_9HYPH|nr:GNAT family N-acetyltransferase [Aureimonas jatrophae]MBB3948968.1 RimJ/RimL family protein N-acetyltransferase [Aureimonas jatrophae]SDN50108.1 Acetyltransferase (GNAT) domain-containing protein [Aureimonas jatrophae]
MSIDLLTGTDLDLDASRAHQRQLTAKDAVRFRDHLLRLDANARRLRFGGAVNEHFIAAYAVRVLETATVLGLFVDGELRGAAELHGLDRGGERAEVAFSLEASCRGAGFGRLLFANLQRVAQRKGLRELVFQCLAENRAMLAIGRRAGAQLRFEGGEAHASVTLRPLAVAPPRKVEATAAAARRGVESLLGHLSAGEAALS